MLKVKSLWSMVMSCSFFGLITNMACHGWSMSELWSKHMIWFSLMSTPQSKYRGRVEKGGVYMTICPLSWSVHHNFERDGRYSEKGWSCTPVLTRLGWFFHHDWIYAKKWQLPLSVYSVVYTVHKLGHGTIIGKEVLIFSAVWIASHVS